MKKELKLALAFSTIALAGVLILATRKGVTQTPPQTDPYFGVGYPNDRPAAGEYGALLEEASRRQGSVVALGSKSPILAFETALGRPLDNFERGILSWHQRQSYRYEVVPSMIGMPVANLTGEMKLARAVGLPPVPFYVSGTFEVWVDKDPLPVQP
ncbi:MAG: hypothetical protein MUC92_08460 [Fimbriimonadaceae bacterium]|jgi:hypothetical protein|nr:hypothetical protein [Fimbriimonadaceae bacterium]